MSEPAAATAVAPRRLCTAILEGDLKLGANLETMILNPISRTAKTYKNVREQSMQTGKHLICEAGKLKRRLKQDDNCI